MASKIILKKSSVTGKVPLTTDLDYGELALNYADEKLYYKKSDGTIGNLQSGTSGGASFEIGEVMLASSPPTSGTWLETGKYYSKAAYPDLATKLGSVADFGSFATVPQAQLPQPFATPSTGTTPYLCATDGTISVVVGNTGAIRRSTDGISWVGVPSTTNNQLTEIRYVNSKFVAVGASGTVVHSSNGTDWVNASVTASPTGSVSGFNSISYGAGVYVIVGGVGVIQYSSNLTSWQQVVGAGGQFFRVIYANSLFVAVGTSGLCYTSPDGITWTSRSAGASQFNDVIYANSLFVTVGSSNSVYSSADGITWTLRTATGSFNKVIYDNGLYVAVGNAGVLSTSPDGAIWTSRATNTTQNLVGVVWNGSNFIAVGSNGVYVTSADGITWTAALDASIALFANVFVVSGKTIAFSSTSSVILAGAARQEVLQSGTWAYTVVAQSAPNPKTIAYNGTDLYVAAGSNGAILTSPDGQAWTGRFTRLTTNFDKVAYLNGNWIAMGGTGSGTNLLTSPDGITWTARTAGTAIFNYAAYGASVYVVIGASGAVYSSPDLVTWTSRSAGANAFNDVIFANSIFVAVGASNSVYSSTNGATWTLRTATGTFNRVIYANSLFVAIGNAGVIYTSPDGTTWTSRTSNVSNALNDVVWNGSLFVAVGVAGIITTSPDGVTWTARTPGDTSVTLVSVSWNSTRFVITSNPGGVAWVSTDGITWTRSAMSYANGSVFSNYLGGKFISVGPGHIQYSTDGLNWVNADQVQYVPTGLNRTYKLGTKYYALSTTAGMYQSSDGITWSAARTAPTRPFVGMTYSGSAWIAVTGASTGMPTSVYKSTDGTTWTKTADFGTLTSTSTLPTAFVDIEYANGNFIIGCPVTTAQNITYTIYTSSDGVTWTGRLTPFVSQPLSALASNGTIATFGGGNGIFKSVDGGATWEFISVASGGVVYLNNQWICGSYISNDLQNFYSVPVTPATGVNLYQLYSSGNYLLGIRSADMMMKSVSSVGAVVYQKTTPRPYGVVSSNKEMVTRSQTALIQCSRGENFSPNLLSEVPLYSYDTVTTFFVPPSSAGGGQVAYIYAGA